mgnify:CR=1 FL=1
MTRLAQLLLDLGEARTAVGEFAGAEATLLEAHDLFVGARGEDHADTRGCAEALTALYTAWAAAEPGQGHEAGIEEWESRYGAGD